MGMCLWLPGLATKPGPASLHRTGWSAVKKCLSSLAPAAYRASRPWRVAMADKFGSVGQPDLFECVVVVVVVVIT